MFRYFCYNVLVLIVLALSVCGCTSTLNYQQIRDRAGLVDKKDGVNHEEAILIAQDFLLRKGLYDQLVSIKPYRIWKEIVWVRHGEEVLLVEEPAADFEFDVKRTWYIYWKDKRNSVLDLFPVVPFYMEINANTGEILEWGIKDR